MTFLRLHRCVMQTGLSSTCWPTSVITMTDYIKGFLEQLTDDQLTAISLLLHTITYHVDDIRDERYQLEREKAKGGKRND